MEPRAIGEREMKQLEQLMQQLDMENRERSGDSDDDASDGD